MRLGWQSVVFPLFSWTLRIDLGDAAVTKGVSRNAKVSLDARTCEALHTQFGVGQPPLRLRAEHQSEKRARTPIVSGDSDRVFLY
jgi:hypothetical protein